MMGDFFGWWRGLGGFEMILWSIALFFSLLFALQTIFSFAFAADHSDVDSIDDHGHTFFTIRNLIAFFTMFGWTGLAMHKGGYSSFGVIATALISGVLIVLVLYFLMRQSARLRHSGTFQIANAIDKVEETYLRIPGSRKGMGKIQVRVQGRLMELDAMTDEPDDILTGQPVRVLGNLNHGILLVSATL